ncbi:Hypothetical predicted protein [Podarcis lilfordi]|uniref:Uncharacterized protein n=1 Tax=Podarcis lilfordi TaxID=74358 RepID=A0AA35JWZ9_9SAUR|nr:Hypothetical predicted protein [Podarcis lilfordi]
MQDCQLDPVTMDGCGCNAVCMALALKFVGNGISYIYERHCVAMVSLAAPPSNMLSHHKHVYVPVLWGFLVFSQQSCTFMSVVWNASVARGTPQGSLLATRMQHPRPLLEVVLFVLPAACLPPFCAPFLGTLLGLPVLLPRWRLHDLLGSPRRLPTTAASANSGLSGKASCGRANESLSNSCFSRDPYAEDRQSKRTTSTRGSSIAALEGAGVGLLFRVADGDGMENAHA